MRETGKTLAFVLTALVLMGAALLASIPKTRTADEFVDLGQPFFPDFKDPSACTSLEVVEIDPATAAPLAFKVMLKNGRWVIPSHFDYPADAKERLAKTAASLIGLTKDTIRSSRSEDHRSLGVLDPADAKLATIEGTGKRITLRDTSDQVLADLILGKDVPGRPGMKFVRRPGQARTYGVNVQAEPSTKFADWIEPNLLQLQASQLREATFDNRKVDADRGVIIPGESLTISRPDGSAPWTLPGLRPSEEVDPTKASAVANAVADLKIVDVLPKPEALAAALRGDPVKGGDETAIRSLQNKGFYLLRSRELASDEGKLLLACDDGVRYDLNFGKVTFVKGIDDPSGKPKDAGSTPPGSTGAGVESRYLFVTALFDPALIPAPKAAPKSDGELPAVVFQRTAEEAKADAKKVEDAKADYDRKVREGTERANNLSKRFAPWYYIVPGDAYRTLVLDRKALVHPKGATPPPPGGANPFGSALPGGFPGMPAGHP